MWKVLFKGLAGCLIAAALTAVAAYFWPDVILHRETNLDIPGFFSSSHVPLGIYLFGILVLCFLLLTTPPEALLGLVLGWIPIIGPVLEGHLTANYARRNAKRPLSLSNNKIIKDFESFAKLSEHYVTRLRGLVNKPNADITLIKAIYECMINNLLVLARGIFSDYPPAGIVSNMMIYEKSRERLLLRCSTDYQSFESAEEPWDLKLQEIPDASQHPGICVRAFRSGKPEWVSDMANEALRHNEGLTGMIAIPLISLDQGFEGALAVVDVVSFGDNLIGARPNKVQTARIERVQKIAASLNEIVRRCDDLR